LRAFAGASWGDDFIVVGQGSQPLEKVGIGGGTDENSGVRR